MSPRQNHRERLLRGALMCLREKGYARTTARDIAAAAESNLGSIGYHFGSKEALLNEAMRQASQDWIEQLGQVAFGNQGATPVERLQGACRGIATKLDEHRPLIAAFYEALAQSQRSNELRDQFAGLYEAGRAAVGHLIRTSLSEAALSDEQIRATASFVIAVCDGFVLQWYVDPDHAPTGDELVAALETVWPIALVR